MTYHLNQISRNYFACMKCISLLKSLIISNLTCFLQFINAICWLLISAIALSLLFSVTSINNFSVDPSLLHRGAFIDFMYGGFVYGAWAFVIGWIVLACTFGMGGNISNNAFSLSSSDYNSYGKVISS